MITASMMIYAVGMSRAIRATVLMLVLLLQGIGNALAAVPPALTMATAAATAPPADHEAMPCHDSDPAPASMPCCDADQGCACAASCVGAASALAPQAAALEGYRRLHPEVVAGLSELSPAHPRRLLRPPAVSGS